MIAPLTMLSVATALVPSTPRICTLPAGPENTKAPPERLELPPMWMTSARMTFVPAPRLKVWTAAP